MKLSGEAHSHREVSIRKALFPPNMSKDTDDTFELYDLRVEVAVPKGDQRRILCGAKEGDYFELKGEMISMPDKQGFSMYSLGE